MFLPCPHCKERLPQGWIVTHGEERDSQQGGIVLSICDEEDPSCSNDGVYGEHPQEAQEGLAPQTVLHGAGEGGCGQDQHRLRTGPYFPWPGCWSYESLSRELKDANE